MYDVNRVELLAHEISSLEHHAANMILADREGVGLPDLFYPFMKFWIIEGPPGEETPPVGQLLETRKTRVFPRKGPITETNNSDELSQGCMKINCVTRCGLVKSKIRLLCPRHISKTPKCNGLDRLHATLVSAYTKETRRMGSFLKHKNSEKKWCDVIYNHVDYYEMLFRWGLRGIQYPEGISVVRADESILRG